MYKPSPELRALQLKCQEILDVIHAICVKYDIQYSLCGGSVVGAHLYGGFIPWDDDVDLMMTRENYNRFLSICQNELPEKYRLINYRTSKEYSTLFSKIIDETTTLIEKYDEEKIHIGGVFLDITCYDRIPSDWRRNVDLFFYKVSQWVFSAKKTDPPRSFKDNFRNIWISVAENYSSWIYHISEKIFITLSKAKKYTYSELFGAFANTISYPSYLFENYSTINFEGKQYMIVQDYVKYLQIRYSRTDFHEPKEKQIPSHYVYVNLDLPYKKYIITL